MMSFRRIAAMSAALLMAALVSVSCDWDDEGYGLEDMMFNYGTVELWYTNNPDRSYAVRLDDGSRLWILASLIPHANFHEGERVWANYTILSDASESGAVGDYNIRLNRIDKILLKSPLTQSFMESDPDKTEFREDSVGRNPIKVLMPWTGGRYLNVFFAVPRKVGTNVIHMLNLVVDDTAETGDGVITVTLRHNAFDDAPSDSDYRGYEYEKGLVSFDLMSLLGEDETGTVRIKLRWEEYDGEGGTDWLGDHVAKEYELTFTPYVRNSISDHCPLF